MQLGRSERFCLDGFERLVIGRATHVALRRPYATYSREHAALTRIEGRWQVADLGSAGGTWMNSKRVATARWLDPGDVFWMNGNERFRYLEETSDPRLDAQARKLADSDDGDAAWLVFADALQELGDEAGKAMAAAGVDPVLPLGFLDRMRTDETVTFACRFGFVHWLKVRNTGLAAELGERVLTAVLAQPVVQFLRTLELDVRSFEPVPLEALMAAVRAAAPRSLKVVRLLGVIGQPPQRAPERFAVEWAPF